MALNTRDIRRIAWDVAEKTGMPIEIQSQIAKDVANAIWKNLFPDKKPWDKVPRKP
jgi:hypothetical protein